MSRWLFGATLTLSAFLLFLVQPMAARAILPWFGGSPSLWTTCMLVFQALLLAGYGYSHAQIRWAAARWQSRIHALLLVSSALLLPPLPGLSWKPADLHAPSWQVALLLLGAAGLPYFVLSTTAPLVQAWYARVFPGGRPYRLYAWSNAASLVALLSYPIVIEPFLTLRQQGLVWSAFYLAFVALCLACVYGMNRQTIVPKSPTLGRGPRGTAPTGSAATATTAAVSTPPPTAADMAVWLWLSSLASVVLLAVTNELCQDIAVVPFLWVVPLGLYLITFVLCFQWDWLYRRWVFLPLSLGCILAMGQSSYLRGDPPLWMEVSIWSATLVVFCMICHGELVRRKPAADHLTLFYLVLAFGGALGGALVALVSPAIFTSFLELPLVLAAIVVTGAMVLTSGKFTPAARLRVPVPGTVVAIVYLLAAGAATSYARLNDDSVRVTVDQRRNFFGVVRVKEEPDDRGMSEIRFLYNGRIVHGAQLLDAGKAREPITYCARSSGIGLAMAGLPSDRPRHIGVVGLGAGAMATYGQAGDRVRFYEINPLVEQLAREYLSFISGCPCSVEVVIGDARVSLERESPQGFDVLVLDAFSGDAIPTHLITVEALRVYLRHLRPDGILAVHISNAYLNLAPVLRGLAGAEGLTGLAVHVARDLDPYIYNTDWVLMARDPAVFSRPGLRDVSSTSWDSERSLLWTDDFSSLARVLEQRD